jgi:hypothetical protein
VYRLAERAVGNVLQRDKRKGLRRRIRTDGEGATEEGWASAEAPAREMGDWLRKNGGPYFLGETGEYMLYV